MAVFSKLTQEEFQTALFEAKCEALHDIKKCMEDHENWKIFLDVKKYHAYTDEQHKDDGKDEY